MILKQFFDSKFREICEYIDKNKSYIDSNPKFRKSIDERVLQWVTLAAIVFDNEDIGMGEFQAAMESLGFSGMITFYNKELGNKINVVSDPGAVSEAFKSTGVPTVSSEAVMSLKELADMFDAKIINIGGPP